jgi:hypothetical protein
LSFILEVNEKICPRLLLEKGVEVCPVPADRVEELLWSGVLERMLAGYDLRDREEGGQ